MLRVCSCMIIEKNDPLISYGTKSCKSMVCLKVCFDSFVFRSNQKRQYKNQKYGFGGQKKRSKMNSQESASDMSGFNRKIHQTKPGKPMTNKNKKVRTNSLDKVWCCDLNLLCMQLLINLRVSNYAAIN